MNSLDVDLLSFLFTLLVAIVSVVWTISNIRHNLQVQISSIRNEFKLELSELTKKVELLEVEVRNDNEMDKYLINGLAEKINHKSKRLENWIQDINKYLETKGEFKARTGLNPPTD